MAERELKGLEAKEVPHHVDCILRAEDISMMMIRLLRPPSPWD